MADYNNIPSGLRVQTQIPLDAKINILNESALSNLGESNNLAYTYHDKIVVTCLQEGTTWIWKQVEAGKENTGLIPIDFVYPFGITAYGIDYSNKKYNFFRVNYLNVSDQKNYDAASLGDGQPIYKDKTTSGNNITFNFNEISTASVGTTGIPVLSSATIVGDNVLINGKRLKTSNLDIKELVPGEISIDLQADPNDVKFYVNENYTGGGSNGSLSKPFTNLKAAFTAFIGTSTSVITPQYAYIGTIELLSNVTVPATGTTAMDYLSVNTLKLKGNGYRITYEGTRNEFISTKYLIDLCPKTTLAKLDHNIFMSFENVIIESKSVHKIVYHLNYTSPDTPALQNTSGISFKNCEIIDSAYSQESIAYIPVVPPKTLFGVPVLIQNTLDKNRYMIRNENINWYGEGGFTMENCKLNGSSSTIVYNLNSSISWKNIQIDFNAFYVNYKDATGIDPNKVYNTIDGVYYILSEKAGAIGRAESYFRIENFTQSAQKKDNGLSIIGGCESVFRVVGAGIGIIFNGSFYSEKANNLVQLQNETSSFLLTNLNASVLEISDNTGVSPKGALKYTGTTPAVAKFIDVNGSIINNVKNWTTLDFIRPSANSAIINGAQFTNIPAYADDTAAKLAGLVPGNVYYDTIGQIATRVA